MSFDHIICSQDKSFKDVFLQDFYKLIAFHSTDHLPIIPADLFIDIIHNILPDINYLCPKAKAMFDLWKACEDDMIIQCQSSTYNNLYKITILPVTKCHNAKCAMMEHRQQINKLYSQIYCAMREDLHYEARTVDLVLRNAGRQRTGFLCVDM